MTKRLTTEQLEAIRKRAEAATEGPWEWDGDSLTYRKHGMLEPVIWAGRHGDILTDSNDAEFVAAARTDIPALLAEVEYRRGKQREAVEYNQHYFSENKRLKAEVARLRKLMADIRECSDIETAVAELAGIGLGGDSE